MRCNRTATVMRSIRSILALSLVAAGSAVALLNCSSGGDAQEEVQSEDAVTGVNNALGLALAYDEASGRVFGSLKDPLAEGEELYIRVRRGTIEHESQEKLDCSELAKAPAVERSGKAIPLGKTVYQGPLVSKELVDLIELYNDERWYGGGATPEMKAEAAKGPDPIVEACVIKDGKPRARLLTNLAYAWDRGEDLNEQLESVGSPDLSLQARRDAGAGGRGTLREGVRYNTIDYAKLCVQELGEIPFFKKISEGKYETFDCRDFVGTNGRRAAAAIPGVEGKVIPLSVDDAPQEECSAGRSSHETYDCVDKCDRGMWLTASSHTGLGRKAACQPGVTVTTAKNDKGTHWVLLCRKVEDTGPGMMKTKKFNDIAIVGNNPATGRTCYFQNKEDVGNDGSRVVHPADVARSSAIWPAQPSSYCTKNCHAADAFIHSPWIDQAKRGDGSPIVPMMGQHPDYPISDLTKPYSLINGPSQGFGISKQLVGDTVGPCTTCHRIAGPASAEFSEWATGTGEPYFSKITDSYKAFEKSHWMPLRLEGLTAANFDASEWGLAVKHIRKCWDNQSDPDCEFAPVPTGR